MNLNFKPEDVFGPQDAYEGSPVLAYVGKQGYFGDNLGKLQKSVTEHDLLTLEKVEEGERYPYQCGFGANWAFTLFLPADAVIEPKKKEKKYRPFKSAFEFVNTSKTEQLEIVVMRDKVRKNYIQIATYLGFVNTAEGLLQAIIIGCDKFGPESLLKGYEWQDFHSEYAKASNTWHPFGVEVQNA